MDLSRRELLTVSALAMVRPKAALAPRLCGPRPPPQCAADHPVLERESLRSFARGPRRSERHDPDFLSLPGRGDQSTHRGVGQEGRAVGGPHCVGYRLRRVVVCARIPRWHAMAARSSPRNRPMPSSPTTRKHAGAELKFVPVDKQLNHDLGGHARGGFTTDERGLHLQSQQSDRHRHQRGVDPFVCWIIA